MLETEMHDLSDDADYAASQQQGSQSLMRSDSLRRSEPEGAETVFVKENVSVHPTQYMSERISGRLKLFKQGTTLYVSWFPYKGQNSNTRLSEKGITMPVRYARDVALFALVYLDRFSVVILSAFARDYESGRVKFAQHILGFRATVRDRNLYTIRPLPFSDVRSIRRHTPAFGWQYVIIVLSSGLAFPPLYFYNGGVKEFLMTIKQHAYLARSTDDANVFLVNNFQDPLQRTLSSLQLPGVASVANVSASIPMNENQDILNESVYGSSSSGRQRLKVHDPGRDLSIQVLEKFSLVTKFARDTSQLLRDDFLVNGRRKRSQSPQSLPSKEEPYDVQKVSSNDPVSHEVSEYLEEATAMAPVPDDPLEFEKLVLVWGKPRQSPLSCEEWTSFLDSEGRIVDSKALTKRIFYGGVDDELRKQVWPFLLGYYEYDSTYAEREYLRSTRRKEFENIKRQWQSISPEQAKRFTKFRERKGLIEKDVVRTDRSVPFYEGDDNSNVDVLHDILLTYSFYNFDLGYCQGMSDYLSPILFVMGDESEAFWCFTALMERVGPNFNRDQNGMHAQLFALSKLVELLDGPLHNYFKQHDCLNYFFCFRWVLIQFKRELEYTDTMRMWEVLWTRHLTEHLHLYVCVAILKRYRRKIIGEQMDFDTLLKFINELSGQIDIEGVLKDAEALCICAGENGAASIPPGTPPSLSLDNGLVHSQLEDEVL